MDINNYQCQSEAIAAYLDGQLDDATNVFFDKHVQECLTCHAELNAQRAFLCELDSALASTPEFPMPQNFARIVAARAESDMSGLRNRKERKRALRLSLVLVLTSFALLGATAFRSLFFSGQSIAQKVVGVFELLWKTLHDAATGLAVVARVLGRGLLPDSQIMNLAGLFLLVLAVLTLSHLISRYHRYQRMRLFE